MIQWLGGWPPLYTLLLMFPIVASIVELERSCKPFLVVLFYNQLYTSPQKQPSGQNPFQYPLNNHIVNTSNTKQSQRVCLIEEVWRNMIQFHIFKLIIQRKIHCVSISKYPCKLRDACFFSFKLHLTCQIKPSLACNSPNASPNK